MSRKKVQGRNCNNNNNNTNINRLRILTIDDDLLKLKKGELSKLRTMGRPFVWSPAKYKPLIDPAVISGILKESRENKL